MNILIRSPSMRKGGLGGWRAREYRLRNSFSTARKTVFNWTMVVTFVGVVVEGGRGYGC